jgi:hypothetical protein
VNCFHFHWGKLTTPCCVCRPQIHILVN